MPMGGKQMDMTDAMVEVYNKHNLDVLVCLGGGGTQKNAYRLMKKGLNIITLPKTHWDQHLVHEMRHCFGEVHAPAVAVSGW